MNDFQSFQSHIGADFSCQCEGGVTWNGLLVQDDVKVLDAVFLLPPTQEKGLSSFPPHLGRVQFFRLQVTTWLYIAFLDLSNHSVQSSAVDFVQLKRERCNQFSVKIIQV